jgi:hypothetical protein
MVKRRYSGPATVGKTFELVEQVQKEYGWPVWAQHLCPLLEAEDGIISAMFSAGIHKRGTSLI